MSQHYLQSSYRERLIEHLFVGELLKHSWLRAGCTLEIAKPEVDNAGYDLIAEDRGITRHIQIKTSKRTAVAEDQKLHVRLSTKKSGCVVWVLFDEDSLEIGPFLFFGSENGGALPDLSRFKTAKHTKGNASGVKKKRPDIKVVPKTAFMSFDSVTDIYRALFERRRSGDSLVPRERSGRRS